MLDADTPVATVVGKTWDLHVREALRISLAANLEILNDTIAYLKKHVDEVISSTRAFLRRLCGIIPNSRSIASRPSDDGRRGSDLPMRH